MVASLARPLLLACILIASQARAGEWRNIGPGGGGWVPSMAVSPADSRTIYAGCDVGGFYRSDDAGENWTIHNTGLHDYYVEAILPHPTDPKVLFVGTEGGVHRSMDGGDTWQLLSDGFPPRQQWAFSAPIGALASDSRDAKTLYAGIGRPRWAKDGKGAIYRSTDGGDHWQLANPDGGGMHPQAIVRDLLSRPQSGELFAATDHGLYCSSDRGSTWRRFGSDLPAETIGRIALCRAKPQVLYVSVISAPGQSPRRGGVYHSDDGGNTWRACHAGLGDRVGKPGEAREMTSNVDHLAVHPENPDIVYAGDSSWVSAGVYRSNDGGKNWANTTQTMDRGWITDWGPTVMGMAMDPLRPDSIYFSTSGQVFTTHDGGNTWAPRYTKAAAPPANAPAVRHGWWSGTGLEVTCVNRIFVDPTDRQHLYICYFDIGLLQSLDGGRSFAQTTTGMRHGGNTFTLAFDPDDAHIIYAGTGQWESNIGEVCRSDDAGFHWRTIGSKQTGLPDGRTYHLIVDPTSPRASRRIYASVDGAGVYCSDDGGATWQTRNEGLPGKTIKGMVQASGKGELLVLLSEQGLYRSTDAGHHWTKVGGETWADAQALAVSAADPNRIYVGARDKGTADGRFSPGGVFVSTDGGTTWTLALSDRFIDTLAADPINADIVYAGGMDHPFHDDALGSGVQVSRDGGKTWQSLNDDSLTVRKVQTLTLDPGQPARLYVGTAGNGVFVRDIRN